MRMGLVADTYVGAKDFLAASSFRLRGGTRRIDGFGPFDGTFLGLLAGFEHACPFSSGERHLT